MLHKMSRFTVRVVVCLPQIKSEMKDALHGSRGGQREYKIVT